MNLDDVEEFALANAKSYNCDISDVNWFLEKDPNNDKEMWLVYTLKIRDNDENVIGEKRIFNIKQDILPSMLNIIKTEKIVLEENKVFIQPIAHSTAPILAKLDKITNSREVLKLVPRIINLPYVNFKKTKPKALF